MKFWDFVRTRIFFRHIALMFVMTVFLAWIVLQLLKVYTRHGEFILLPDFVGKPVEELIQFADEKGLEVLVIDSTYDEKQARGSVKIMDPLPNTGVKSGRKIYVTIVSATPERVVMPDLHELSLRQAVESIEGSGLRVDHVVFVEGPFKNAVAGQRIGSRPARPGELVPRNTRVVIEVEKGMEESLLTVPDVIGFFPQQAYNTLHRSGFNTGRINFSGNHPPDSSKVIRQFPGPGAQRNPGTVVDLSFGRISGEKEIEKLRENHRKWVDTLATGTNPEEF